MRKLVAPVSLALGFVGMMLTGFLVSAHASAAASPTDGNLTDLARPIFDEIMKGHYIAAAAFALVLSVALVKRYAPGKAGDFVHSDAGGAATTLLMAFGGALATATVGGAPWTWGMAWAAAGVGVTAAGGYTMLKKLFIEPLFRPLVAKLPAWMQPIAAMVLWVFDRPVSATEAADAAGVVAVQDKPAAGADGVTGAPKDL